MVILGGTIRFELGAIALGTGAAKASHSTDIPQGECRQAGGSEIDGYVHAASDVFLVLGRTKGCLYDLRKPSAVLYHLDKAAASLLGKVLSIATPYAACSAEAQALLGQLCDLGLLLLDEQWAPPVTLRQTRTASTDLTSAWLEFTTRCNLRCVHCYLRSEAEGNDLLDSDFPLVLDRLSTVGLKYLQIIGGEPLLRPDSLKVFIALCARRAGWRVEVCTNGTLLDREWAAFLREHKTRVSISVYGATDKVYAAITGSHGILEKHKEAIAILEEERVAYRAGLIRMNQNAAERLEDVKAVLGIKSTALRTDIVRLTGRAAHTILERQLRCAQQITPSHFERPMPSAWIRRNAVGHGCVQDKVYVRTGLDVYPCVMDGENCYGNLRENSLKAVLARGEAIRFLTKDNIQTCSGCEFRYACHDCRPNRGGRPFLSKPWYCSYNPVSGTWQNVSSEERCETYEGDEAYTY